MRIAAALIAVTTAVAVAPQVGGTSTQGSTAEGRRSQEVLKPVVLAESAVVRPYGVAPAPDGSTFVSEEVTQSIYRVAPDGTRSLLDLDLEAPAGLHLGPDGTLYVADGTRVTTMAPDGTQGTIPVEGAALLGWVGVDAAGSVYTLDRNPVPPDGDWTPRFDDRVVRVDPDGTQTDLDFGGIGSAGGLDVTTDGTVSVLDIATGTVVRRAPDGTLTDVVVPGAEGGRSVDVDGDRLVVGGPTAVLLREPDGTVAQVIDRGLASQVLLTDDGTIWAAADGFTGCRCPDAPGAVYRLADGGEADILPLGDLADFGSVAAGEPGTVLYTSWEGPAGYSDLNPLRQVTDEGTSTDLPVDDATWVDAAPDGTLYYVPLASAEDPPRVVRRDPDGTTTTIDLAAEPGVSSISGLSVDEEGRLFVAMGSGYGTGPFTVVEPLAAGGPRTWYRSPDSGQGFMALGTGAGTVQIAVTDQGAEARPRILVLREPGTVAAEHPLSGLVDALDVDGLGTAYAIRYAETKANGTVIEVVAPDGATSSLTYVGMSSPRDLSISTDGTIYVADTGLGVIALFGAAGVAGDDDAPPEAAPAVPVSGQASFTG